MSRILLADDSPHAQRMGERILRDEGFEVVTVTDGETAIRRLADVDPDLVIADVSLPGRSGYEICREIRNHARFRHVRVVLTAGLLERVDETQAVSVRCDAILKKPFEASVLVDTVKPLISSAQTEKPAELPPVSGPFVVPAVRTPEEERVRAAVTVALDAAMPALVDEITRQVLVALRG